MTPTATFSADRRAAFTPLRCSQTIGANQTYALLRNIPVLQAGNPIFAATFGVLALEKNDGSWRPELVDAVAGTFQSMARKGHLGALAAHAIRACKVTQGDERLTLAKAAVLALRESRQNMRADSLQRMIIHNVKGKGQKKTLETALGRVGTTTPDKQRTAMRNILTALRTPEPVIKGAMLE